MRSSRPLLALPGLALAVSVSGAAAGTLAGAAASPPRASSATYFEQMATVLQHPRCMNCHTNGDFPRQADDRHRHAMNVARGPHDHGAASLPCASCHQEANSASGVPGVAGWRLAPLRMGWEGLSAPQLCRALRDPRKGAMAPHQLVAHFRTPLVRWSWSPGADLSGRPRTTPPLSHDAFIRITKLWVASGAKCPG